MISLLFMSSFQTFQEFICILKLFSGDLYKSFTVTKRINKKMVNFKDFGHLKMHSVLSQLRPDTGAGGKEQISALPITLASYSLVGAFVILGFPALWRQET